MSITTIIGGARSGKSRYAEELCKSLGGKVCYIATAKAIDADMEDRIKKHRAARSEDWETIEKYDGFDRLPQEKAFESCSIFLLDCVTIMITNIMFDQDVDFDTCSHETLEKIEEKIHGEISNLIKVMKMNGKKLVVVTNEVGMGLVPAYRLGSIFRDIAGRMNQFIAKESDEVYNIICGLPQKLK